MRRSLVMLGLGIAVTAATVLTPALPVLATAPLNACATQDPAFTTDDPSGFDSPCAVAQGSLLIEALYFQNASRVGGTALAAYPLFRLRTGIAKRLEAVIDAPSQIAESGKDGIGLYPRTHYGYGLDYTFDLDGRTAGGIGLEMVPPSSRFSVNQVQPRYILDLTTGYRVTKHAVLSAMATGTSSSTVGLQRVNPALALRGAYETSSATEITTDIGERVVARHAVSQSFGDVAVNQRLRKNLTFDVGVGTTFNPVANAKAHYLASGLNLHL